jgi:protein ImuB
MRYLLTQAHSLFAQLRPEPASGAHPGGAVAVATGDRVDPTQPFVLALDGAGGPRIAALNIAAEEFGLRVSDSLADARAKAGKLQVRPVDPAADDAALRRFALWATRYTPAVSVWGESNGADGFFLEITGAAHLFGGEAKLLADLAGRLARFGLPARLAIADTPGAAWALSRFHSKSAFVLPSGEEAAALAPLSVAALRLSPDTRVTLRRLGFKKVGALIDRQRAPFASRFERELLTRLDQALGRRAEPLTFIAPLPIYRSTRSLLEPIVTREAVVTVASRLMKDLVPGLARDGVGARTLQLALHRVDNEVSTLDVSLTLPTRDADRIARLIDLKLDHIADVFDAGYGFEVLNLTVTATGRMTERQTELTSASDETGNVERCAALVDSLRQRLGARSVKVLRPVASHVPERAEAASTATGAGFSWPAPDNSRLRPPILLRRAEPAEVTAAVPEGPPKRFRWRGITHDVAWAQGPERIAGEWWRRRASQTPRDYYVVEDKAGRHFWLYREGIYGRDTATPRWFVHGLFA